MDSYSSDSQGKRINPAQILNLLAGPDEITVTTTSQPLEDMGITLNSNLKRITLIPAGTGIFWADGTAIGGVNPFPSGGMEIECTSDKIATREFITSAGTVKMSVIQEEQFPIQAI